MRGFKELSFSDRLKAAAEAKQAQLEKARQKALENQAGLPERLAARATLAAERDKRQAERKAAKLANAERLEQERAAAEIARVEAEKQAAVTRAAEKAEAAARQAALEIERKAARDARYAARKKRQK